MKVLVEKGHPYWHDATVQREFTCPECGTEGFAEEANAYCEECGEMTYLPVEVPMTPADFEKFEEDYGDLQQPVHPREAP